MLTSPPRCSLWVPGRAGRVLPLVNTKPFRHLQAGSTPPPAVQRTLQELLSLSPSGGWGRWQQGSEMTVKGRTTCL